ncbi:MAG: hypothetical protein EAZ97_13360 [Bacteroidetes bacterium]|nr:MAG: hypothetical protein EAZ97_13360 [Bacteroidota bacterium]
MGIYFCKNNFFNKITNVNLSKFAKYQNILEFYEGLNKKNMRTFLEKLLNFFKRLLYSFNKLSIAKKILYVLVFIWISLGLFSQYPEVEDSYSLRFIHFFTGGAKKEIADLMPKKDTVTTLDLIWKGLTEVPTEIYAFANLKILVLEINALKDLPEDINRLEKLEELYLMRNKIELLPTSLFQIQNLKRLNVSYNQLKKVPKELINAKNLKELILLKNNLEKIPEGLSDLSKLQVLDVSENSLEKLPDSLIKLKKLRILAAENNQLSTFPTLDSLSIEEIRLSNNQLTNIPAEIGFYKNLKTLHLSGNQLTSLPKEIGLLVNLENLSIAENQIVSLPEEIKNLKKLTYIYLRSNKLSETERDKLEKWFPNMSFRW